MIDWSSRKLQPYSKLPVLVTGGSGFIGRRLIKILETLNADVTSVSRSNSSSLNTKFCNLSDFESCRSLFLGQSYSIIFHLAGWVSSQSEIENIREANTNNVVSTLNILEHTMTYIPETRIIMPGSILENSEIKTPYSVSKTVTSLYSQLYKLNYHANISPLNICMTYGPNQNLLNLIPYTITSLMNNETPVKLKLNRQCDVLYIDDVVNAILLAGLETCPPEPIYVGTNTSTTVKDITDQILTLMDKNPEQIEFNVDDTSDLKYGSPSDLIDAKEYIPWQPMWTLEDGLAKTIQWYISQARR